MVSPFYLMKGKMVMLTGLSTKLQLIFGRIFDYVKPIEIELSAEAHRIHVIVIRKIITTKATKERCSRTKSFTESKLQLIPQIDTYVEYARTSNLVQTGVSHI